MAKTYHLKSYPHIFYVHKNGHKRFGFRYTYIDSSHKRHEISRRNFGSVQEANLELDQVRRQVMKGNANSLKFINLTISEWVHSFIEANRSRWKVSTYHTYLYTFRNFIIPTIGNVKVQQINKNIYQRLCINKLIDKGLKHSSIVNVHHRMITLMNSAVDNDIVSRNKLSGTKIPTITGKLKKRLMTADELAKFNRQLKHEPILYQTIFHVLEDTGMREGELLGLTWQDIILTKLRIHINHTRDNNGLRTPKTPHSRRSIGISKQLAQLLIKYQTWQVKLFKHLEQPWNEKTFVFTTHKGVPMSNTTISRNLSKILKQAGLGYLSGHFTAHTFRHMFASYLLNNGMPLTEVSHALGHANPQITLAIYTQRNPASNKNLGSKIEQIYHNKK
ncbi:tyrosine-type recombinase/integrase [Acetilactobacillus jinshanensis]|uniref:Site-specific integrase n=1 Tax=Acetilactobacillus jinshanensis TaxID=1720083 RepID=A0A4P6ZKG1_9LACO|nr:site-specific integrase [Acetilactobacillus jinshanensis]QBP18043.1 site-specific integrase [Acetilactobacillus jinshanensis]URL60906.1 site-specific integrase [uncultured bacterium]